MAENASMNQLIVRAARRGAGVMDRLPARLDEQRASEFHEALSAAERAIKAGDATGRDIAEARLDRILDDARAARQEAAGQPTPELAGPGFDGGVRGRRRERPTPGIYVESAGQLFQRAMKQSLVERAERGDDERVIVTDT
jgi:hypothetical protein